MATLNSALQVMIDSLHAKMISGAPLTPQEQSYVAVAIAKLNEGATWEQALIAVAEQHLDTATTSLGTAATAATEAKDTLIAQAGAITKIDKLVFSGVGVQYPVGIPVLRPSTATGATLSVADYPVVYDELKKLQTPVALHDIPEALSDSFTATWLGNRNLSENATYRMTGSSYNLGALLTNKQTGSLTVVPSIAVTNNNYNTGLVSGEGLPDNLIWSVEETGKITIQEITDLGPTVNKATQATDGTCGVGCGVRGTDGNFYIVVAGYTGKLGIWQVTALGALTNITGFNATWFSAKLTPSGKMFGVTGSTNTSTSYPGAMCLEDSGEVVVSIYASTPNSVDKCNTIVVNPAAQTFREFTEFPNVENKTYLSRSDFFISSYHAMKALGNTNINNVMNKRAVVTSGEAHLKSPSFSVPYGSDKLITYSSGVFYVVDAVSLATITTMKLSPSAAHPSTKVQRAVPIGDFLVATMLNANADTLGMIVVYNLADALVTGYLEPVQWYPLGEANASSQLMSLYQGDAEVGVIGFMNSSNPTGTLFMSETVESASTKAGGTTFVMPRLILDTAIIL